MVTQSFGTARNFTPPKPWMSTANFVPLDRRMPAVFTGASASASKPRVPHTQRAFRIDRYIHPMPHAAVQSQGSAMMASRPFSRLVDRSIESLNPVLQSKDATRRFVPSRSTPIESISTLSPHRVGESPNGSGHQRD